MASTIPGRRTMTGTFPIKTVLENERLGGDERGAVGTGFAPLNEPGFWKLVDFGAGRSSRATVS